MKKLLPIIFLFAFCLVPRAAFALNESCANPLGPIVASSSCCTAPAVVEDGGGCPPGTTWIGDAVGGECKTIFNCPDDTYQSLSCNSGSCYKPGPPPTPLQCPSAGVNTDTSLACCTDGQIAVRDSLSPSKWKCANPASDLWVLTGSDIYYNAGKVGIGTISPGAALSVDATSGGAAAMGFAALATGDYSVAMGLFTNASGAASTAMGQSTRALGIMSTAMGLSTIASGDESTAMGHNSWATGNTSTAMGWMANASGSISTAMGNYANADSFNEVAIGRYNVTNAAYSENSWVGTDPLFVVGNGTSTLATANALTVLKNGNVGIGTATPTSTLEVNGTVTSSEFCIGADCLTSWPTGDSGRYVGSTPATYDGSQGDYSAANNRCVLNIAGSHICTAMEMISSYNNDPSGPISTLVGSVWVNNGPPGYISNVANDCQGWDSNGSTIFGYVWDGTKDASYVTPCNLTRKFACCK